MDRAVWPSGTGNISESMSPSGPHRHPLVFLHHTCPLLPFPGHHLPPLLRCLILPLVATLQLGPLCHPHFLSKNPHLPARSLRHQLSLSLLLYLMCLLVLDPPQPNGCPLPYNPWDGHSTPKLHSPQAHWWYNLLPQPCSWFPFWFSDCATQVASSSCAVTTSQCARRIWIPTNRPAPARSDWHSPPLELGLYMNSSAVLAQFHGTCSRNLRLADVLL